MIQEKDIRAKLAALERGELSLWGFYDWIESDSQNMGRDSSAEAVELVGSINLLFADYDLRLIDEVALRQKLSELIHYVIHSVVVLDYAPNVVTIDASPTRLFWSSQRSPLEEPWGIPQLV